MSRKEPKAGNTVRIAVWRGPHALTELVSAITYSDGELQMARFERPYRGPLEESWKRSSAVRAPSAETLHGVLTVLLETVPSPVALAPTVPPPAEWSARPVERRPTAANPRAFKGTKYQPPKAASVPAFDLRPYLCTPAFFTRAIEPLLRHLPVVRAQLLRRGYSSEAIDRALRPWPLPRPRFGEKSAVNALVSHLEVLAPESMPAWCRVIAKLPESRQSAMAQQLFETGAYAELPPRNAAADVLAVSELASEASFGGWIGAWLRCRNGSSSLSYLAAGFRLAAVFDPRAGFREIGKCEDVPEGELEELGLAFPDLSHWLVLRLWRLCGERSGIAGLIRGSRWREMEHEAAASYLGLFAGHFCFGDAAEDRQLWNAFRGSIPAIEAAILAAPREYQNKVARSIRGILYQWEDAGKTRLHMRSAIALVSRLARLPFSRDAVAAEVIASLFDLGDADRQPVLAAPDRSWEALEKACRRNDDSVLVARGLRAILRQFPDLPRSTFLTAPGKLLRAAKALGVADRPSYCRIIAACRSHRLFQIDPSANTASKSGSHADLTFRVRYPRAWRSGPGARSN